VLAFTSNTARMEFLRTTGDSKSANEPAEELRGTVLSQDSIHSDGSAS
jgi:hypothetical protein